MNKKQNSMSHPSTQTLSIEKGSTVMVKECPNRWLVKLIGEVVRWEKDMWIIKFTGKPHMANGCFYIHELEIL